MSVYDLPIDLVYLYVNSSDEAWIAKRNQYAMDQINGACRFRDNKELMYSLRSVEKYAPWINNIYIVTDSSIPDWLNADHPKLHIVQHEEIMPPEILPCYNSNVIEAHIWRIPNLSEIFLYANDDMFLCNNATPDFFVKDGKPLVRMQRKHIKPDRYYYKAIMNARKVIDDYYGKEFDLIPWHNIDVYTKTGMKNCVREFQKEFDMVFQNHVRKPNNLQRVIFHYYLLCKGACLLVIHDQSSRIQRLIDYGRMLFFPAKYLDGFYSRTDELFKSPQVKQMFFKDPVCACRELIRASLYKRLFSKHPVCACINDSETTTEKDIIKYKNYMETLFPEKSSFEN